MTRTSKRSSPRLIARRSRRRNSRCSSVVKAIVKRHERRASGERKGTSLGASMRTINSSDSSSFYVCGRPRRTPRSWAPTPPTMPGSPMIRPSTATLRSWGQMTRSVGGWARQTGDPGWWLLALSAWCLEEASRVLEVTASSSSGEPSNPSLRTPDTLTPVSGCGERDWPLTPSSIPSSGTRPARPFGVG